MNDQVPIKVLKKRGRKPKNKTPEVIIIKEESPDSDKEIIITYLPINSNDLENNEKDFDNFNSENDIFIKSESFYSENKLINENKTKFLNLSPSESENKSTSINNNFNRINVHFFEFTEETKCWWCKHTFSSPRLGLPEQHYNETFYCTGNYCSWECMKAYNIDTNDNFIWKRESLINLMYFMTYGLFKDIKPAASWLILKDYGGNLSIVDFRKNFDLINNDYLILHPPLISRQMQIEESYKKKTNNGIVVNKLDKLLFENNSNLTLRRNKPVETSQINLEKSMGLKRFNK